MVFPYQLAELRRTVGDSGLITAPNQLQTYECDGLTNFRVVPAAVALRGTQTKCENWSASAPGTRFRL